MDSFGFALPGIHSFTVGSAAKDFERVVEFLSELDARYALELTKHESRRPCARVDYC